MSTMTTASINCYCCSGKHYQNCCEPFITRVERPATPEQLMRSRYSAFAIGNTEYLLFTSSINLRSNLTEQELKQTASAFEFIKLAIIYAEGDHVEFVASLLLNNELHTLHETSLFIKEVDGWKYDSGELVDTPIIKLGRNDECPCGSGKKFKKCHLK